MRYLTIKRIKQQCIIDKDYHEDDELLCSLATAAEDMIEQELDKNLDEYAQENDGELPVPIQQACLMVVDSWYSANRGSAGNNVEIPNVVYRLIDLYKEWK